ncbi:hypothetical protein, partial [Acidaminococcus intestini]
LQECIDTLAPQNLTKNLNSSNLFMKRKYRVVIGKEIVDKNKKIDEQNCKNKGACLPCFDDEKA